MSNILKVKMNHCKACGNGWWCRGCGGGTKICALEEAGFSSSQANFVYRIQFGGCDLPLVPCFLCNLSGNNPPTDKKTMPSLWIGLILDEDEDDEDDYA